MKIRMKTMNDISPQQEEYEQKIESEKYELDKLAKKYLWCVSWQNGDCLDISLVIHETEPSRSMALDAVADEVGETVERLKELEGRGDFEIRDIYKVYPVVYSNIKNTDNNPF